MKKTILLTATICLATLPSWGQKKKANNLKTDQYECLYSYQVKNAKGNTDETSTILQIEKNEAYFTDYTAFQADSAAFANAPDKVQQQFKERVMKNDLFFDQTVFQSTGANKMTVYSIITPNYYTYSEPLHPVTWSLSEKTDTVCGYVCKTATGEYGGRKWEVWYAPKIPAAFGPWKFCGLPGLVMKATDTAHIHQFTAIAFRKGGVPFNPTPYDHPVKTNRAQFVKAKNHFEEDPMKNIPAEAITNMEIRKYEGNGKAIFMNGVQLRTRPNGYIPLEIQ